jgi:hypothetical protein
MPSKWINLDHSMSRDDLNRRYIIECREWPLPGEEDPQIDSQVLVFHILLSLVQTRYLDTTSRGGLYRVRNKPRPFNILRRTVILNHL